MKNLWQIFEKNTLLLFLLFWFCSAILLFVASPYTSPANPYYAADSSVFYLMGRGILHGLVPYRDIFDHKGPLLYYIYALGQWLIPGKAGVFLLQTASMGASCALLWKFFRLHSDVLTAWFLLVLSLVCIAGCIECGALTEEWSLPLSLLPLYIVARHLTLSEEESDLPKRAWFVIGLTCAAHFLLRFNNAAPVCGLATALCILFLWKRKFLPLLKGMFFFAMGILFPLLLGWILLDASGATSDFLHSYIKYNFVYAGTGAINKTVEGHFVLTVKLISLPLLFAVGLLLVKKRLLRTSVVVCFLAVSVISTLSILPGRKFLHYGMIYMPAMACTLVLFSKLALSYEGKKRWTLILLSLFSLAVFFWNGLYITLARTSYYFVTEPRLQHITCEDFSQIIPREEQSSFLGIDIWPLVYLHSDIMPCNRYFFLQSFLAETDPSIEQTMENIFRSEDCPRWVAIRHWEGASEEDDIREIQNETIRHTLTSRHQRVSTACQRPYKVMEHISLSSVESSSFLTISC